MKREINQFDSNADNAGCKRVALKCAKQRQYEQFVPETENLKNVNISDTMAPF